jgi:acyl transferase domain-containing protein/thioesterase domain-containing protein/acyl carrier protein/SAM-dependent methyltransferase
VTRSLAQVVFRMVAERQLNAAQAQALIAQLGADHTETPASASDPWTPIAVIGLSGQFPGARDASEFWQNLCQGRSGISEVPPSRWEIASTYDPDSRRSNRTNCKWGGFLDSIKELDSLLFNISPREAELMDPQQCYFLEQAWNAIEDAGYGSRDLNGARCGVFVGAGGGDFIHKMTAQGIAPDGYAFMGNAVSILAARVSYLLNLKGPALAVDTACSSSLVAIHLACQSIASGVCDLAIAGGVCVLNTPSFYIAASKTGMLSPTGQCRSFDRAADGFVPGEAAAALLLKRLDHALRDGDHIYGVIEGSAMNQDGRTNGITAPNGPSQTALALEVYRRFGISPESIGYVEAHGTGTPLGDPIEVDALSRAFRHFTPRKQFCAIGSVKSSVGHTMTAAGAVGMIRALLSLHHRRLTPSLHFSGDNPAIGFSDTPFFVNTELRDWTSAAPLRAAISAFGFSGTNVHMVVREAPAAPPRASESRPRLFALSARTDAALRARACDLAAWLRHHPDPDLDAVSFTLNAGRTHFDSRAVVVASDAADLLRQLETPSTVPDFPPDLAAPARRFLAGEEPDWRALYSGPVRRLSLPTYPFERRPCPLPEQTRPRLIPGLHPDAPLFTTTLRPSYPFLRDHDVAGRHILPGVCYLELAVAAVRALPGAPAVRGLRDIAWLRPLVVGAEPIDLTVRLTPESGRFAFSVDNFCRGVVETGEPAPAAEPAIDIAAFRRHAAFEIDAPELYEKFRQAGVALGPFCRGVEHIWMTDASALGELIFPAGEAPCLIHPTLLDGAFQIAMAWIGRKLGESAPVLVPASIGVIEVLCTGVPRYAFVEPASTERFHVSLLDDEGAVLARIRDFSVRPLAQPQPADIPTYEPVWIEQPLPPSSSETAGITVLFVAQASSLPCRLSSRHDPERSAQSSDPIVLEVILGDTFRSLSAGVFEIDQRRPEDYERLLRSLKPIDSIYFLAESPLALFHLLKSLRRPPSALYVLTVGAQPVTADDVINPQASACIGLAMAAAREYRKFAIHIVDLHPAELSWSLLDAERAAPSGSIAAYRRGIRYVRHLRPLTAAAAGEVPLRKHGAYVIVGGAGGLGLTFARHLAANYQARLLLIGRSPLSASQQAALEEIRALGSDVVYERADVTDPAALRRAFHRFGAFHGVIHAAMVLADRSIETMDEETFLSVLAPKVAGTVALFDAIASERLDFVALFSSANSFFGNAGQANYAAASTFQDAYGLYAAQTLHLPVRIINWGFWGEVGAVASPFYREQAEKHGVGSISPAEGIRAFHRALASSAPQLMPMKISPTRLAELGISCGASFQLAMPAFEPAYPEPPQPSLTDIPVHFAEVEHHGRTLLHSFFLHAGLLARPLTRAEAERAIGLHPKYARLFDALLDILARDGVLTYDADTIRPLNSPAAPTAPTFFPWCAPFVRLLDACVPRYREVLSGAVPATEVLFPGSSLALVEPLYKHNPISDFFNRQAAEAVSRAITDRLQHAASVRIVEIGAGTGGITAGILEALRPQWPRLEYHYTDVSPGFVRHGQKHFADGPVRFTVLDIENDPEPQGFTPGSFDIAIASNVLHATSDILRTSRHVRRLLAPGGVLVLNEATRVQDFSTLTFGLTDGYWLYRDPERRLPHSPLLDQNAWREVLAQAGFPEFSAAASPLAGASQSVLLARADSSRPAATGTPAPAPVPVRVSADSSDRVEATVRKLVAQALNLAPSDIHVRRRFSDYGVDSIVGVELIERLNQTLGADLRVTALFDHGSVHDLAAHLVEQAFSLPSRLSSRDRSGMSLTDAPVLYAPNPPEPARAAPSPGTSPVLGPRPPAPDRPFRIAVTGLSGRFPDAPNARVFWQNLIAGRCAVREVPRERWDVSEYYAPAPAAPGKSPCKWGGFLSGIDEFDPLFFQMSGVEAEHTDPQQRLFLEECWKAFEDAGYSNCFLDRRKCGVFAGVTAGDYLQNSAEPSPYAFLGNGVSILASRIAYLLNLKGPALAVDTACSSSLIAIHLACQSIANGECELALAGGVFLTTTPAFHRLTGTLGMLSPTGACRAFDDAADGFVPGEGVGVVVLRPLQDALRDGDHIYGVILASGANQDGNTNGITAPSSQSQADLELEVYRKAGVDPATIGYVEAHGTGTRLGDPVEIEGLTRAFSHHTGRKQFCAIGSVKSNIGHAGPAAGIAGLIKVLLSFQHRQLPPSLHFDSPNRHIRFADTPFYVNREARPWEPVPGSPRRAAVSAFGLSGTNAHLLVEDLPSQPAPAASPAAPELITLSAKSAEALHDRLAQLAQWLESEGARYPIHDIAYTLNAGRTHFEHRAAFVASDVQGLLRQLRGTPETSPYAQAYVAGEDIDWERHYAGNRGRRIPLPAYPFRRGRYWVAATPLSYFRKSWRPTPNRDRKGADGPQLFAIGVSSEQVRPLGPDVRWLPNVASLPPDARAVLYFAAPHADLRLDKLHPVWALAAEAARRPLDVVVLHPSSDSLTEATSAIAPSLHAVASASRWTTVAIDSDSAIPHVLRALFSRTGRWPSELRCDGAAISEPHWVACNAPAPTALPPIRRGGVYWIAGGSGALGGMLARHLTRQYDARVIVTSRHSGDIPGDVSDPARMREIAAQIRATHGAIHGVFHCAGIIGPDRIDRKTAGQADAVLAPKVLGAVALDEATRTDALDFFVLFSSLSAAIGDFGQCDYAVANRFLDAFAERRDRLVHSGERNGKTVSIGWPLWAGGGMHLAPGEEAAYTQRSGLTLLAEADGLRALEHCLASSTPHVLVVSGSPALLDAPAVSAPVIDTDIDIESHVRNTIASLLRLNPADLASDVCLNNFGLDSLNMKDLAARLSADYSIDLSPTLLFQHNSIAALSAHLRGASVQLAMPAFEPASPLAAQPPTSPASPSPIAIIGLAGRFPQSPDLDAFWQNLADSRDLITEIPPDRWNWRDYQTAGPDGAPIPRWGGFMPGIDKFDAAFFGISPREAALMDPQHRIFLETVWQTLENAGYAPSTLAGRKIGIFAGAQLNEYMRLIGDAGEARAQAALGNTQTMLANRVSFWFDFRGPSETIDTACSSALVAIHHAVRAIRNGDCEMALAGGVSAILSPDTYILASSLGMLSPDGRCKTFDKSANGYVKGEGVGALLLKPLDRALADGDHIHAVIRATAENHGGRANFLTAPNPEAQAELLQSAYSEIDPGSVSYIETHGTGTELGDPIEVDALKRAFAVPAAQPFCGLGSVKSNVGHLEPAAGIAGLLKVVLALRHRRLPATLHVHDVNPYLRLDGSPFYLLTEPRDWPAPAGGLRRAGVSAFGFGGSNAHAVLEEFPPTPTTPDPPLRAIVPFSARDPERLRALITGFRAFLTASPKVCWRDLVFTLQTGRETMKVRLAFEANSSEELARKLDLWLAGRGGETLSDADWTGAPARRIPLPTYPFAPTRHWFDVQRPVPPALAAPDTGLIDQLRQMLGALLYLDPTLIDDQTAFTDLGLDSILAVEFVKQINDAFRTELRATRLYDSSNLSDLARAVAEARGASFQLALPAFEPASPRSDAPLLPRTDAPPPAVTALVAAAIGLSPEHVDEDIPLMELGLDLFSAAELARRLREDFGATLQPKELLCMPSVRALSTQLTPDAPSAPVSPASSPRTPAPPSPIDIAIVGMSGRFPGARNLSEFWNNLARGIDSVTEVPAGRWPIDRYYDPTPGTPLKTYCRTGGFLDKIDQFDPLFFQISPQEAEWMDPQQRLFLEEAWLALEDAGCPEPKVSSTSCAVYVGVSQGDYFQLVDTTSAAASQFSLGNVNSILAARIAYFLNLKGPAVALDTACSSSLVAVHLASQALRAGECEMALAGGVSVMTTPHMYILGSQGRMLSADGRCKTFDQSADGFVPAEGAGAVVLKRLSDAIRDGDRIHAVIRGSGVNQDGRTNGITAPSAQSQAALETAVYERFQLDPSTFGYVEAHGTGTALGDPIELDALTESFRNYTDSKRFCAIGSAKSNIGHPLPAAGIAGLIKTVLALQNRQIPPSLHCNQENDHIDLAASPFFVNRDLLPWTAPPGSPRRAAVSSFGFSGTNAHVVLEEAPAERRAPAAVQPRVFVISAKTPEALRRRISALADWITPECRLDDLAFTLAARRTAFRHCAAFTASTHAELIDQLRSGALPPAPAAKPEFDGSERPISLPPYPFVRRRCWAKKESLLDSWQELVQDHKVRGEATVPAVLYLEIARVAIGGNVELRNISFSNLFHVKQETSREFPVRVERNGDRISFDCKYSRGEALPNVRSETATRNISEIFAACPQEFSADLIYTTFEEMGATYGPAFRRLEWVRVGEHDAIGRIAPPPGSYEIHPGVLDAALQTMIGFALRAGARDLNVPFALDRYCVHAPVEGACFGHAQWHGDRFDVQILDLEGNVLVSLEGFTARPLQVHLLEPVWEAAPAAVSAPARRGAVLIFRGAEDLGLAAALARIHSGATVIPVLLGSEFHHGPLQVNCRSTVDFERALRAAGDIARIYFLGTCSRPLIHPDEVDEFQESGVLSLFRLTKALTRLDTRSTGAEIIVVTNNVHRVLETDRIYPQAGSLNGFARVLAAEFPEWRVSAVDVHADGQAAPADAIAAEPAGDAAIRGGRRYVRRLAPAAARAAAPVPLREGGVYIILGGMGGLGLTFARYLASAYRARLALVGRSASAPDLQALGEAIYLCADVTDAAQMARVRDRVLEKWGQVHGVIDSAFVLRDGTIRGMEEEKFRAALDPKLKGTATALWTFREDPLDWFALFSSSISFTAGPGQSNYAAGSTGQDALGLCWNGEGRWPVRVINWGYWGQVGSVASEFYRERAAALGVGSIEAGEGIEAFRQILAGGREQVAFIKTGARPTAAPAAAAQPITGDAAEYVRGVISATLQLTTDDFDDDRPFEEYGVDSLVSVTILAQLEGDLGSLDKTMLFEHNTARKLAAHLAPRFAAKFNGHGQPATTAALYRIRETGAGPKSFWVHSVVGEMNWAVRLAHHMGPEFPVFGFKAAALETGRPPYERLEEMAAAYVEAVRKAQPHGPYLLGGYSFGGSVAFEMARQLAEAGERISWLLLLDAYAPGSRALHSLASLNWDGFLPQVIANLLIHQWKGTMLLAADALPKDDPEAQIRLAARHVRSSCAIPQTEAEIAAILRNSARAATIHAELQQRYEARPCPAIERTLVVRNRHGFVGAGNTLGLPRTAVDDAAADHGWSRWLGAEPLVMDVDADHFSMGLEPAIAAVGRRVAELIGKGAGPSRQRVFEVVRGQVLRILPDLPATAITMEARLKDLGANSLDRIEVATSAMEELEIDVPRTRLAGVDSLGSLVDALLTSLGEKRG